MFYHLSLTTLSISATVDYLKKYIMYIMKAIIENGYLVIIIIIIIIFVIIKEFIFWFDNKIEHWGHTLIKV